MPQTHQRGFGSISTVSALDGADIKQSLRLERDAIMRSRVKIAALFGNQIYLSGQPDMDFVPHDVVRMASVLAQNAWDLFEIRLNFDDVVAGMAIDKMKDNIASSTVDWDVLIYYAGHGDVDGNGYWNPSKRSDADGVFDIVDRAIELVCQSRVHRLTLVLDACRAARISTDKIKDKIKRATASDAQAGELVILAANWDETHESSLRKGGDFTLSLLDILQNPDDFPKTWKDLGARLADEYPDRKHALITIPQNALDADLPFAPVGLTWPTMPSGQLRFLLKNADPNLAFGALFGASRMDAAIRKEVHRAPDSVLAAADRFSLSQKFASDTGGSIDWGYLDRMTLVAASPFHAVTEITIDISEALTVALAKLLFLEESPELAEEASQINHLKAQELIAKYIVTIDEFSRLGNRVRVLIAHVKPKGKQNGDAKAFAFRFLRTPDPEATAGQALSEDDFKRPKKELLGISAAKEFFTCIGRHTSIRSELHTNDIGVAYVLRIRGTKAQTLTPFLTQRLSDPEPETQKAAASMILSILHELFGRLGSQSSKWRFKDDDSLVQKLTDQMESDQYNNIRGALENMRNIAFSGEIKTNSLQTELRFVERFFRSIATEAETVDVGTIFGVAHGDMHQKNIIVPLIEEQSITLDGSDPDEKKTAKRKNFIDFVSLIDFENSKSSELAFLDLASLEVSLVVFFLEDYVGFKKLSRVISRIESEWLSEDIKFNATEDEVTRQFNGLASGASEENLHDYSRRRFFPDYNAYEGVAHSVIGGIRLILRAAICRFYENREEPLTDQILTAHLRQYYMLLFLRAVRLITVASAPKALVINYAYWLANQLRTDSDLMYDLTENGNKAS